MPSWNGARDRLPVIVGVAAVVLAAAGWLTYGTWHSADGARAADDPYFRSASCAHPRRSAQVEITGDGLPSGCVRTDARTHRLRLANRVPDRAATICLGSHGTCVTGHDSPFPEGRLTLVPGESVEVVFPLAERNGASASRRYPITLTTSVGNPFANRDLVVNTDVK